MSNITDRREWQPIETAPRDGTDILVFADTNWGKRSIVGRYEICPLHGGVWAMGFSGKKQLIHSREATHWQPLPEPPLADSSQ